MFRSSHNILILSLIHLFIHFFIHSFCCLSYEMSIAPLQNEFLPERDLVFPVSVSSILSFLLSYNMPENKGSLIYVRIDNWYTRIFFRIFHPIFSISYKSENCKLTVAEFRNVETLRTGDADLRF